MVTAKHKDTENQSFDRGITIMEVLAKQGSCSLADLHKHTGIPKSSIRRLLGTLTRRRLARRSLSDDRYRLNCTLPVTTSEPMAPNLARFVDISMPHLMDLTARLKWPSDIHIFDGKRIDVVDSTRPLSPYHLYAGLANRRINLFASAAGQACLACMTNEEIVRLERSEEGNEVFGLKRFNFSIHEYIDVIEKTRKRGYATRLKGFYGETTQDDGLNSIALAILDDRKPVGAATVIWPRSFMSPSNFAKTALPDFQATVTLINKEISQHSF